MLRRMFLRNVLCLLAAAMILAIGCSGANKAKYIPSEDRARLALEAALTAWQKGEPFGTKIQIDGSSVDVNDSKWQKGEKLLSFEIVRREPAESPDRPLFFLVRIKLATSSKEQEVRYVVFGKEPLWVHSEADYNAL